MPTAEAGLMSCLSRWTDDPLLDLAVKLVLGSAGDDLPKDFAEDRGRLYLGENWAEGLKQANAQIPHFVAQMRALGHGNQSEMSAEHAIARAKGWSLLPRPSLPPMIHKISKRVILWQCIQMSTEESAPSRVRYISRMQKRLSLSVCRSRLAPCACISLVPVAESSSIRPIDGVDEQG